MKINDKNGADNLVDDHLSRIKRNKDPFPIQDDFLDEQLIQLCVVTP